MSTRSFFGHIIFMIKQSIKFALLTIGTFFIVGMPIAYVCYILKVDVRAAGIMVGVIVAILVLFVDFKRTHCLQKIHDDRLGVMKDFLK